MRKIIKPVKGMQDFYPDAWAFQKWLSSRWLGLGASFGYQEFEGPLLEPVELYLEKSSEEIITEQTYGLVDRNNKRMILRPELTPTLARMIAQRENDLTPPIRWQSYGRFFRYERPQRGRGRSFFSWNIDLIGSDDVLADTEILTIACRSLKCLGITPEEVKIKINNRKIMREMLRTRVGASEEMHLPLFRAVDRMGKVPPDVFTEKLGEIGLSKDQVKSLITLMEEKDPSSFQWFGELFQLLGENEVADYCELDLKIIRGFDYYTATVFEAWANTSLRRALFGGGRYDNLTRQVGGKKELAGVGFAAGDMAVYELLAELKKLPSLAAVRAKALVTIFSPGMREYSIRLSNAIRKDGIDAELYPKSDQRLDRQMRYAGRSGIPFAIIIGPDEIKRNTYILKKLKERTQAELGYKDLIKALRNAFVGSDRRLRS
jgi:histidyl-tRNA synthetase